GIRDCAGNEIGAYNKTQIGLPQPAASGDVVINEVLFNPKPDGEDYVEIYNRSTKVIDAVTLSIANRNSAGNIAAIKQMATSSRYLFPGDYAVITTDAGALARQYFVKDPDAVLSLTSLPAYPNDKGTVVLLNRNGIVIDEFAYSEDFHFSLISDKEGVALERIDPTGPTQQK